MKITKQRLKEIIREELTAEGSREDMMMPALSQADFDAAMATDEPRHEGGTPEERLLNKLLIVSNIGVGEGGAAAARKLGLGGDEEVIAYLDDLLGNQMYKESAPEEGSREDQELLSRLKQKYGRKAAHFTVEDIQDLHPSYKGSLRDVAQGLGIRL